MNNYMKRYEDTWLAAMTRLDFDEDDRLGLLFENTAMILFDLAKDEK